MNSCAQSYCTQYSPRNIIISAAWSSGSGSADEAGAPAGGFPLRLPDVAAFLVNDFTAAFLAAASFSTRAFAAGPLLAPALALEVEGIEKE